IFETNLNLGLLLAASGDTERATRHLKAATQLQPASHPQQSKERAWLSLGKLQLNGNPSAAEQAFSEAAKLAPADPQPHLLLAELYANAGKLNDSRGQYQQALEGSQGDIRAQALR